MSNYERFYERINQPLIPALNGVRFIAVFLVIFYHLEIPFVPGGHGVMLFFVLSGFLITWLLLKENNKFGTVSIGKFFQRRVLRIFPAFYTYWLIAVAILVFTNKSVPWAHAVSSLFYFSNYYSAIYPESNNLFSHTWSLAIEEQFYLCFPFLFFVFANNTARLLRILAMVIFSIWVWRFILVYGFDVKDSYIYGAFDTRVDHLLIGCVLAIVLWERKFQKFWEFVLKSSMMPLLSFLLLLLSISLGSMISAEYKDTFGFIIEPVLMSIIIVQLILFSEGFWWKWLEWRTVQYLGMISYSLYLYQQLTLYSVAKIMSDFPVLIQIVCAIAVTIITASFSYYVVERYFLKFRNISFSDAPTIFLTKLRILLRNG